MHDNKSLTTGRTNTALARMLADVADALAEFDHLPALDVITVSGNPTVAVGAGVLGWGDEEVRGIALWARSFASPVVIDLSLCQGRYAEIRTTVTIGGRNLVIARHASRDSGSELCHRLGFDLSVGGQIEVSPHALLAMLKVVPAAEAVS